MKSVHSWNDLQPLRHHPPHGGGLRADYRILFDVTARGRKSSRSASATRTSTCPRAGTAGAEDPHVGCIMLSQEMLQPLAVFALLESGCKEVYLVKDSVYGIEATDAPTTIEDVKRWSKVDYARRLAYSGTAGDRNVHVMSGRVV